MSDEAAVLRLAAEPDLARALAERCFTRWMAEHASHLPVEAEVRHRGATAVPGCLTKGDLDIVVRVPADRFDAAQHYLDATHQPNLKSVRREDFAAYSAPISDIDTGVQLVIANTRLDVFERFYQVLLTQPERLADYNALKRRHEGGSMADYRIAKSAFIQSVLKLG